MQEISLCLPWTKVTVYILSAFYVVCSVIELSCFSMLFLMPCHTLCWRQVVVHPRMEVLCHHNHFVQTWALNGWHPLMPHCTMMQRVTLTSDLLYFGYGCVVKISDNLLSLSMELTKLHVTLMEHKQDLRNDMYHWNTNTCVCIIKNTTALKYFRILLNLISSLYSCCFGHPDRCANEKVQWY